MTTILVSGASTIIGYGVLRSIRQAHPEFKLVGISVHEDSAAPAFCDVFEKAPLSNDENYIYWLMDLVQKYNVSLAIPGIELDVFTWSEHFLEIEQCGVKLLINNPELIQLCADKWLFYKYLIANKSPYAISTALEFDEINHKFPLLLKPRNGSGSRGISVIENIEELQQNLSYLHGSIMIQPVVGSKEKEYTTSGFFDFDSQLHAHVTLKRKLSPFGFTETAEIVKIDGIEDAILELGEIFKPVGPTNFQFRLEGSQLKLLEINPRISSTTSIRTAFGYNESAMGVEMFLGNTLPSQQPIKSGRAFRYVEDLIYYDSTNF